MSEMPMPIPQEGEQRSATEGQINKDIKESAAETEISGENRQRATRITAGAIESAKQITSLGPSHPFWGEKGRWQEIEQRPDDNPAEEVATVLQVIIPSMKETAEAYGKIFPPDTTLDLALQHVVMARILGEAERIGGTSQELPSRLPGLKEDAPPDYLQKIQIISRLVPTLRQNAKTVREKVRAVRESEGDISDERKDKIFNTLNESLDPGVLQPEGTKHQGFVNTLGSTIVQLKSLQAEA
jgi:hypothetical protein